MVVSFHVFNRLFFAIIISTWAKRGDISVEPPLVMRFRRVVFSDLYYNRVDWLWFPISLCRCSVFLAVARNSSPFAHQSLPPSLLLVTSRRGALPLHMASCNSWVADTCLADATNFILHTASVSGHLHSNETAPIFFSVKMLSYCSLGDGMRQTS
jgi:hypothetical protein